jgi:predicted chitinase
MTALDKIGGIRIPVVSNVAEYAAQKGKESALKKQVQESINYNPMADALRKGNK